MDNNTDPKTDIWPFNVSQEEVMKRIKKDMQSRCIKLLEKLSSERENGTNIDANA